MLPSLGLVCEFWILIECNGTLLNFPLCSTLIYTFFTAECLTSSPTQITRRTSRHCLGTFIAVNLALPIHFKCSVSHYPPTFYPLSLSLSSVQRVIAWSRKQIHTHKSDYGLDDRAIGVRSPAGAKDFSSSLCVQTGSGAHPASCTMGTGGPFPGGKSAAGAWRWPLTPI